MRFFRWVNNLVIDRAQLGWRVEVHWRVTTANQFTDEHHATVGGHRWLIGAVLGTLRQARRERALLMAKPGEREARGWV